MGSALALALRAPDAIDCPFAEGVWWEVWRHHQGGAVAPADDLVRRLVPLHAPLRAHCVGSLRTESQLRAFEVVDYCVRDLAPVRIAAHSDITDMRAKHSPWHIADALRRAAPVSYATAPALRDTLSEWIARWDRERRRATYSAHAGDAHATLRWLCRWIGTHDPGDGAMAGRCATWLATGYGWIAPEYGNATWEPAEVVVRLATHGQEKARG